jgi:tetratricopeptide (TPR) repeat protein
MILKLKKNFFLFIALIFFFIASTTSYTFKPKVSPITYSKHALNFDHHFLRFLSLGNYKLISSFLWVYTLMESDIEHHKGEALSSWLYLRFFTMSQLDPLFKDIYIYGGQYLSVIKDDIEGASHLFNLGLSLFPKNLWLNYFGGMHYYLEEQNYQKALESFDKIKFHPKAPATLTSITARLKLELKGELKSAKSLLEHALKKTPKDSAVYQKISENLKMIQIEIDLRCLNSLSQNCKNRDPYGQLYEKSSQGHYSAPSNWKPFRIKKRKEEL